MLWRPEREGRARAGWLRAGPASPRGGKAGGRAPRPLARSLAPSLRRWVSQSIRLQPASPRAAEGSSLRTPAPPPAIVRPAAAAAGAGARGPEPPVRRGGARAGLEAWSCPRGDGPGGRGGATASLSPTPRRPQARGAGSLAFALRRLRGWSRDVAGPRRRRRGLIWGSVSKLGLRYIFDAGKSVPSGLLIIAPWAETLEGNQMGENCRFGAVKVLGAAAERFLRDEVAGLSGEAGHNVGGRGSPARTLRRSRHRHPRH